MAYYISRPCFYKNRNRLDEQDSFKTYNTSVSFIPSLSRKLQVIWNIRTLNRVNMLLNKKHNIYFSDVSPHHQLRENKIFVPFSSAMYFTWHEWFKWEIHHHFRRNTSSLERKFFFQDSLRASERSTDGDGWLYFFSACVEWTWSRMVGKEGKH